MSDPRSVLEQLLGASRVSTLRSRFLERELPLAEPADDEQACELLRLATRAHWRVLCVGGATKLGARADTHADLALSTRALAGIVEYEPVEGVLTARAGTRMSALREATAREGHWLTPLLAREDRATLGGVLSAGESGLDRLRFGPVRHHVLGMRVALGDGTIAKCGGRLVKNVTGFDLQRLYTGAHGSLCLVLEASLRLFAAPHALAWIQIALPGWREACASARALETATLRPLVLALGRDAGGTWELGCLLGAPQEALRPELERLRARLPRFVAIEGPAALTATQRFAATSALDEERAVLRLEFPAPRLEQVLACCAELDPSARALVLPGVAVVELQSELADVEPLTALADVRRRNPAPPRAASGPARALEARIQLALDPGNVFAGGAA